MLRWNPAWAALMGDPTELVGRSRNQVWFEMTEDTSAMWVGAAEREQYRDALVSDLRVAQLEHPDDAELADLVQDLHAACPEFTERWHAARPAVYRGARKNIEHPRVGHLVLDGDVFCSPGSSVRVVVYSAVPGSPDATRLAQLQDTRQDPRL